GGGNQQRQSKRAQVRRLNLPAADKLPAQNGHGNQQQKGRQTQSLKEKVADNGAHSPYSILGPYLVEDRVETRIARIVSNQTEKEQYGRDQGDDYTELAPFP